MFLRPTLSGVQAGVYHGRGGEGQVANYAVVSHSK
jgi:hypothetical protein